MSSESPFEFPCDFPIKVFGRNEPSLRDTVLAIVGRHFDRPDPALLAERPSRSDTYLSITVTVHAESREQLDAAYRELSAHEDVMMVL